MQWFQYRPGVVVESQRVAHRMVEVGDVELTSWCQRKFHLKDVEETCEPNKAPESGEAAPGAPCVPCLLRVMAATETPQTIAQRPEPDIDTRTLAGMLRKAQWMLDDAAHYLPEGRCSAEECGLLAKTLEQLSALIRQYAADALSDEAAG